MSGGAFGQAGYHYQNLVAADWLIQMIEVGSKITKIKLENPDSAPHIDDVIVEHNDGITFIQVKWSSDRSDSITLASLTTPDEGADHSSLIGKIANGYLATKNSAAAVEVVLLSTRKAGVHKRSPWDHSLHEFITGYLAHLRSSSGEELADHEAYSTTITRLKNATAIENDDEFRRFLTSLNFWLEQPDIEALRTRVETRLLHLGVDTARLANLLDAIVKWSITRRQVDSHDVLAALGVTNQFHEARVQHFPVDPATYVHRPDVFESLDQAFDLVQSGFVLVEGAAGTGKSTVVSQYLSQRPGVLAAYYCYVPGETAVGRGRLTANALIATLCKAISTRYPDVPEPLAEPTLDTLNAWMASVVERGNRLSFVIDGLDHVTAHSDEILDPLTRILTGSPPPGVTIVLTSRSLDALPRSTCAAITSDPHRIISIPRFNIDQVDEFMRRREVVLTGTQLEAATTASDGLPVYLEVFAAQLRELDDYGRDDHLSNGAIALNGHGIESFHHRLWSEVSGDMLMRRILALLSRRDDFTDLATARAVLAELGDEPGTDTLSGAVRKLRHILRVTDANSYALLHASLAEFIRAQTDDLAAAIFEAQLRYYEERPDSVDAWRHRVQLLAGAGRDGDVVTVVDDQWLFSAWLNFRPIDQIDSQIRIAVRCAEKLGDVVAFTRLVLLRSRLSDLQYRIEESAAAHPVWFLALDLDTALGRVWDGASRSCTTVEFARFVNFAEQSGRRLPERILRVALADRPHGDVEDYADWIQARSQSEPLDGLLAELQSARWPTDGEFARSDVGEAGVQEIYERVAFQVVRAALQRGKISAVLQAARNEDLNLPIRTTALALAAALLERANLPIDSHQTLLGIDFNNVTRYAQREIALELCEAGIADAAPKYPDEHPALPTELLTQNFTGLSTAVSELWDELRWAYATEAGIEHRSWVETISSRLDQDLQSVVVALSEGANLWAKRTCNQDIANGLDVIKTSLIGLVRHTATNGPKNSIYRSHCEPLLKTLVDDTASLLSDDEILALAAWWAARQNLVAFSGATTTIIETLVHRGLAENPVIDRLITEFETWARADQDADTLTNRLTSLTQAAAMAGRVTVVKRVWGDILQAAQGVHWRKDYQFNEAIDRLPDVHRVDPSGTIARVRRLLEQVALLSPAARSRTSSVAAQAVINFLTHIEPSLGLLALSRLDDVVWRSEAVKGVCRTLLRDGADARHVSSLVATMDRWHDYSDFNDNTWPTVLELVESCLEAGELAEATRVRAYWRHVTLVQKRDPKRAQQLDDLWAQRGLEIPVEPALRPDFDVPMPKARQDTTLLSPLWVESEQVEESATSTLAATQGDGDRLRETLVLLDSTAQERQHKENLERLTRDIVDELTSYPELPATDFDLQEAARRELADQLRGANGAATDGIIRQACLAALQRLAPDLATDANDSILATIDLVKVRSGLHIVTRPDSFIENALASLLPAWITSTPFSDLDNWELLAASRSGDVQWVALVAIARRVAPVDPNRAESLLKQASTQAHILLSDKSKWMPFVEAAKQLEPHTTQALLLGAFRIFHEQYPGYSVHVLGDLLDELASRPDYPAIEIFDQYAHHNDVLIAGLISQPLDLTWLERHAPRSIDEAIVGYLFDLFNHPVVDIRILAARELRNRLTENRSNADQVLSLWSASSRTAQEWCVAVLTAAPEALSREQLGELVQFASPIPHHNIRATIAYLVEQHPASDDELRHNAHELVSAPKISIPSRPQLESGELWLPPYYEWFVAAVYDDTGIDLEPAIRANFRTAFGDPTSCKAQEARVRENNHINSNFERIEVAGPYDEAARASINQALYQCVVGRELATGDALELSRHLRVMDPQDLLEQSTLPPMRSWNNSKLTDQEFLEFEDLDQRLAELADDPVSWPLHEHSERRTSAARDQTRRHYMISKVRIRTFLFPSSLGEPTLDDVQREITHGVLRAETNRTLSIARNSSSVGTGGQLIKPSTIQIQRLFRGRFDLDRALPDMQSWAAIHGGREVNPKDPSGPVTEARLWQSEFDQDRRRHEPSSAGFELRATRSSVMAALSASYQLWAHVFILRSMNGYEPEPSLTWVHREALVRLAG